MYQDGTKVYIQQVKVPQDTNLPTIQKQLNGIFVSPGKNKPNQDVVVLKPDSLRIIINLLNEKDMSNISSLLQISQIMVNQLQYFQKIVDKVDHLFQVICQAILRSLKQFYSEQSKIPEQIAKQFFKLLFSYQKMLKHMNVFKLFLAMTEVELLQVTTKGHQQILNYYSNFINKLRLIQHYTKNQKQEFEFKAIRRLIHVASYILSWFTAQQIPINFYQYIRNHILLQKKSRVIPISHPQTSSLDNFIQIITKFGLVDPQFRFYLLANICDIFSKGLQNIYTQTMFKSAVQLMNKKIFGQQYQNRVLQTIEYIREVYLKESNIRIYNNMVEEVLKEKNTQFLIKNKKVILKLAVNQQIQSRLFQLYYKILSNKTCDQQIANYLIQWNIKDNLISNEQFVQTLAKAGFNKISPSNQKLIYSSSIKAWNPFITRLIQSKYKHFKQGKIKLETLILPEYFEKNYEIYYLYTKLLIQIAIGFDAQKFKTSSCFTVTINQSADNIRRIKQYSFMILQRAIKNKIVKFKLLLNFFILISIIQIQNILQLQNSPEMQYFMEAISQYKGNQISQLLKYLQSIFKVFKNAFSLYLIFFCGLHTIVLQSQNARQCFFKVLQKINKVIQNQPFAKITAYNTENLKIALFISHFLKEEQRKKVLQLIASWTALYNKTDIQIILYQFDKSFYSNLIPFLKKNDKSNQNCAMFQFEPENQVNKFVCNTLQVLLLLLKTPSCPNSKYLIHTNNCINFIPIQHLHHKPNNISIQFKVLINSKLCCNSTIQIYGSSGNQSNSKIQKHRIIFKDKKIVFYNRNTKTIEGGFQDIQDGVYARPITFSIDISNNKIIIQVNGKQLASKVYQYSIDSLRFDLQGDILIKQFKWQRIQQQRLLQFDSSYQIHPNQAEIKISRIGHFQIGNFQQKLNFSYFFLYLRQIIKTNYSNIDLNLFYSYSCQLMLAKQVGWKNQFEPSQYTHMKKLLQTILICADNIHHIQIPNIIFTLENESLNGKKYFQFLIATLINEKFLAQAKKQCLKKLFKYLHNILFDKSIGFGFSVQNRKTIIFVNLVKLLLRQDEQVHDQCSQLLKKIIYTHEANQILLKKMSILFSVTYKSKSNNLRQFLNQVFDKIISALCVIQNQENYHLKILGKFFISQYKSLQYIFMMIDIQTKFKMLDTMIDDQELGTKCFSLFKDISEEQTLKLSDRIVIYAKKGIFDYFDANRQTKRNLQNLMFFLKQISIVYKISYQQNIKEVIINILCDFMKKSCKFITETNKTQAVRQFQNFYFQANLLKLIALKIERMVGQQYNSQLKQNFVYTYFNNLLLKMPKFIIIKALQQILKSVQNPIDCCIYLLKQQFILMLPQRSLSGFLQFIIQIFILAQQQNKTKKKQQVGSLANQYLQKLIKNYQLISKISRPLLYSFPRLQRVINFTKKKNSLQNVILNVTQTRYYQLRGGIFLKIICLIFYILETFPQQDLSVYITFLLEKSYSQKEKKNNNIAIYRATNDFIQVNKQVKSRSPVDLATKQVIKEHQDYFDKNDEENLTIVAKNKQADIDLDLTPFFIDYFFMKMFIYLENHCTKEGSVQQINVCMIYSRSCINYLNKKFMHIFDQISQSNSQSIIDYETVQDLQKLIQKGNDLLGSDRLDSPEVTFLGRSREKSHNNLGFAEISNSNQIQIKFLQTPAKKKLIKRGSLNIQFATSGKKKKKQLFVNIESDIYVWSQQAKKKRIHRFFRDESKQIFFHQLLHKLFVVNFTKQIQILNQTPRAKRVMQFINQQQSKIMQQQQNFVDELKQLLKSQIRRVYRFTSKTVPQLKLKKNKFPNMTSPFVVNKQNIIIKNQEKSHFSALSPQLISTLLNASNEQLAMKQINFETIVCLDKQAQTKVVQVQDRYCQISYPKGVYFCEWNLTSKEITFTTQAQKEPKGKIDSRIIKYGSPLCNILTIQGKKIEIKVSQIHQIFYRKYNQIKNNSLQFFLNNGFSIYIIFYTQKNTKQFIKKCKSQFQQFKSIKIVQNHIKQFQSDNFTQKWVLGQLSNFDYLMLINKYAGRSFCDLNQYYVFPWVLQDYSSSNLDLSSKKIYRDLKKPIGALRQQKLQRYLQKLEKTTSSNDQYLYGSHYSTSLFVYYYLVRLQPFTSLHKDMQSGQFDAPDRLFSSIQQMWQCLISESATSDVKEAIPEFYYFPTFLKNINSLNLGKKQSGTFINNVQLPKWATSPADFILKMRICLESDQVSSNLNYWIDLVFGKDQKSLQKFNLFHPLTYADYARPETIQLENLDAIMSQITFFGQNPYVLFPKQHPKKKIRLNPITSGNLSIYNSVQLPNLKQSINQITTIHQQQNLGYGFYVSDMSFKNKSVITMKISQLSKNTIARIVDLEMQNTTIHSLLRTIQKGEQPSLKNLLSLSGIQQPEYKISVSQSIAQHQIKLGIGVRQQKQIVKTIRLQYNFEYIKYNQTIFVVYGSSGLRVYDWNGDILWEFSNEQGQISQCFLEYGLLFFLTSWGRLFVYDFFSGKKQLVYRYQKLNYNTKMLVFAEKKCITRKNQNYYKILMVGDRRKIVLLHYSHKIGK